MTIVTPVKRFCRAAPMFQQQMRRDSRSFTDLYVVPNDVRFTPDEWTLPSANVRSETCTNAEVIPTPGVASGGAVSRRACRELARGTLVGQALAKSTPPLIAKR